MLTSRVVPEPKVEVEESDTPVQEGRSDRSPSTAGRRKPSHDSISPPASGDHSVIGASWAAKNLKKRIRERAQTMTNVQESSSSDLPYHMCPHCCLTFAETRAYNEHLDTHKSQEGSMSSSVQCGFCEMTFSNSYLLTEHQKLHSKACGSCGKAFMTEFDFNLHVGTHTGFTYDCKDCGRCFPCRKTLAEHNKSHRIVPASADDNVDGTEAVSSRPSSPNNAVISPVKKPKLDIGLRIARSMSEKDGRPESLFDGNPYYNELLRESPRKRRPRGSRMTNVHGTVRS
ncbi:zinc finger protein 79-like protein [Aphelenchoides avenae]|nr:zinc finger protein 79-like protein [Aphelenchus avenae]